MSLKQVAIAIDQLANAVIGGYADETLSARAHRKHYSDWVWQVVRSLTNFVFFWQADHCLTAYLAELERKQLPQEYRD